MYLDTNWLHRKQYPDAMYPDRKCNRPMPDEFRFSFPFDSFSCNLVFASVSGLQ